MADIFSQIATVVMAITGLIVVFNGGSINISEAQKYFYISTIITVSFFLYLNKKIDSNK